eukprot:scaffold95753_cov70-Phaeocystis_antarctica.AAC.9
MSGLDIIEGRASTETRAHSSHNGPGWSGWVWVQSDPVNNLLSIVGASKEWSSEYGIVVTTISPQSSSVRLHSPPT